MGTATSAGDGDWESRMLSNPGPWIRQCIWQGRNELVLEALGRYPKFLCARFSGNVTPLLAAAYAKQRDLAEKLLAMGAKLDYITAIALNRREIVETMLEQEPRLIHKQAPDRIGSLHVAAHFADGDLVSMLLSRGADANDSKNPKMITPIFFAWTEPLSNAEILLRAGADVNARSKHGFTPLHWAAKTGRIGYVRLLLAHGAFANAQTNGRQTAWAFAVRHGHREVASLLDSV